MQYLRLTFSGVMQHYSKQAHSAIGDSYPTERMPTRDAVNGLIGCAMGLERGDDTVKELHLDIKYVISRGDAYVFRDYQTVKAAGKGFETFSPVNNGHITESIVKTIEYIYDTAYDVYVGGDAGVLHDIYRALADPVYGIYFGKRCCVPNAPVIEEEFRLINKEDLPNVSDCP